MRDRVGLGTGECTGGKGGGGLRYIAVMRPEPDPPSAATTPARAGEGRAALTVGMLAAAGASAEDGIWIDVIRKMDEVYNDLLQYEVALEEKNAKLEDTQKFIFSVLTSMSDLLVVCDRHGVIQEVNQALASLLGIERGRPCAARPVRLVRRRGLAAARRASCAEQDGERVHDCELLLKAAMRQADAGGLELHAAPYAASARSLGLVITGRPVGELRRAYEALRQAHEDLKPPSSN
jgi:two-component system sensor histidine kinase HupT/HoxJ